MDAFFTYRGLGFEWDLAKASTNLAKHGIMFEKACEVFFDPFLRFLDKGAQVEGRDAVLGMTVDWTLLFVVHLVRHGQTVRLISARPATPSERRDYENE